MTGDVNRPSVRDLMFEQYNKQRERRLELGTYVQSPKARSDEDNPRTKYKNWQCIGVRAMLEANKRLPGRGLSWFNIGRYYDVPYLTVRKLAEKRPLPTGKMYRPSCFPTEAQILYAVEELTKVTTEIAQVKSERKRAKTRRGQEIRNQTSMADQRAVSRQLETANEFDELCRKLGIAPPTTRKEATEAVSKVMQNMDKLNTSANVVHSAYQQATTLIDQKEQAQ